MENAQCSRSKNTFRNIFFGFIEKLLLLLFPFAIRTIIIYKLGAEYVGVGSLLTSILQVLSVAELGFASAICFALYGPIARGETDEIIKWISLLKAIYRIVGLVILFFGLILLPFIPFFIKDTPPDDINMYILYCIFLCNTIIPYFTFGYKNSILSAHQRYDIINKINIIIEILKGLTQIVVLLLFKNYYIYIIALPLFTLLTNIILDFVSNKLYPELNVKTKANFKGIGAIKKQIAGITIGRVSLVCRNSFDSIIISSILGLTITAIYSNYYLIFSSVFSFLSILLVSMAASVGNSLVTEDAEKNERDHIKFDFFYMYLVGFCTICLFGLYQPFMKIWVGEELMFPNVTMYLFCIYFYVNSLSQVRSVYSEAAGLWWHFRYLSIAEMSLNLILNIVLGIFFGVNGILFATIITASIFSFICLSIITYIKLFKKSSSHYFICNLLYALLTLVVIIGIYFISSLFSYPKWVEFFVMAGVCVCGGIILLLLNLLFKDNRKYVADIINKFKRRNKNVQED